VAFAGTDALSGGVSCEPAKTYGGPDDPAAPVSGSCVDAAGNAGVGSAILKFDATGPAVTAAPTRAPDGNGWFNHPVDVAFSGSDPLSGGVSCDAPKTYAGGDGPTANVPGTCTDAAGNSSIGAATFAYDSTAPAVTSAAPDRAPDQNGWYTHPLTVGFGGSDATSGIAGCSSARYEGPDSGSASAAGTCQDNAGNTSAASGFGFQYDGSGPTVRAAPARAPDANGWYNHALSITFEGSDGFSGVSSCTSGSYAGPDSGGASVSGSCTDKAGNVGSASFGLKYDATAPSVTAQPSRAPDGGGWYTHAVTIGFTGTDGLSGMDSCTSATYSGPDAAGADVSGSCRDNAGNSSGRTFAVRYDATAPTLSDVSGVPGDASVRLNWKASADTAAVTVTRTGPKGGPVRRYTGGAASFLDKGLANGTRYRYTISARDAAGNVIAKTVAAVPLALFAPAQGARVSAPPLLQWKKWPKAGYYNVQVMHKGKVLSTWPTVPHFQMPKRWRFGGSQHVLEPGLYRWYVWPGFGPRSKAKYGPRIGGSYFVVVKT
jgi:hypothetical protein